MRKIVCDKCSEENRIPDKRKIAYCVNCGNKLLEDNLEIKDKENIEKIVNEKVENNNTSKTNNVAVLLLIVFFGIFIIILLFFSAYNYSFNNKQYRTFNSDDEVAYTCKKITDKDVIMRNAFIDNYSDEGYFEVNDKEELDLILCNKHISDFDKIVKKFKDKGYTIIDNNRVYLYGDDGYYAFNNDDYILSIEYDSGDNTIDIMISAPKKLEDIVWPNMGLATKVPVPTTLHGLIQSDSSDYFDAIIGKATYEEFLQYVEQVKAAGFINDYDSSKYSYFGLNNEDISVQVDYYDNNIYSILISDDSNYDYEE